MSLNQPSPKRPLQLSLGLGGLLALGLQLAQAENLGEYRARLESTLSLALWRSLSLNLPLLDLYDTAPAQGVNRNELQIRSTLGITF